MRWINSSKSDAKKTRKCRFASGSRIALSALVSLIPRDFRFAFCARVVFNALVRFNRARSLADTLSCVHSLRCCQQAQMADLAQTILADLRLLAKQGRLLDFETPRFDCACCLLMRKV